MADHPILFSAPMIRALIAGRKTMTRRLLSPEYLRVFTGAPYEPGKIIKPSRELFDSAMQEASGFRLIDDVLIWQAKAFEYQSPATRTNWQGRVTFSVGQHLWVREAFCGPIHELDDDDRSIGPAQYFYRSDGYPFDGYVDPDTGARKDEPPWHPSIHMPRSLSRLTLEVKAVKIERLRDISKEDAIAEGIAWSEKTEGYSTDPDDGGPHFHCSDPRKSFESLFCSLHDDEIWEANPEVVALTFTVRQQNIDTFLKQRETA